jgi:sulfite exporter TauE/SafE
MFGLDDQLAALGDGAAFAIVAAIAILLGLRHATDPDHLTAVTTLVAGDDRSPGRAGRLGLAWGLGHATTLFLFGLPIVLFNRYLPERVTQAAEVLIGLVIVALALRLLLRWSRGELRMHAVGPHDHLGGDRPVRTLRGAYAIGLVHGIGGSAGVGVLLLGAVPSKVEGVLALLLFAVCTALSMCIASSGFGAAVSRPRVRRRFLQLTPGLAIASLAFGAWYSLGALETVPYVF